jgi:hypothetical protein
VLLLQDDGSVIDASMLSISSALKASGLEVKSGGVPYVVTVACIEIDDGYNGGGDDMEEKKKKKVVKLITPNLSEENLASYTNPSPSGTGEAKGMGKVTIAMNGMGEVLEINTGIGGRWDDGIDDVIDIAKIRVREMEGIIKG